MSQLTPSGIPTEADQLVARLERIPVTSFHWRLASLLGTGTFMDAYDSLAIASALTVIITTFHISFLSVGILLSSAYVGQFFGSIVAGYLSERVGRKPAFVWFLTIMGAFSLLAAFAWNLHSLLVFRFLEGLGLGGEVPVAGALFSEFVQAKVRGRINMLYESVFSWGFFFTPLIALGLFHWLGGATGWRVLFALGSLPLVVALWAHRKLPESVRWLTDHGKIAEGERIVSLMEAEAARQGLVLAAPQVRFRADTKSTRFGELFEKQWRKRTALTWILAFCNFFSAYGYSTWLPTLYVKLGGLPPSSALGLSVVTGLIQMATAYTFAFTVDSFGRRAWFVLGFATATAGALFGGILTMLHVTGWPVLFCAGLGMMFGTGPFSLGIYLYISELFPTRMRAWATGLGGSVNRVASFVAPTVVGMLLSTGLGISSVFFLFAAVLFVGLVTVLVMGIETKQKVLEDLAS